MESCTMSPLRMQVTVHAAANYYKNVGDGIWIWGVRGGWGASDLDYVHHWERSAHGCGLRCKDELSTPQAIGQMANKHVYAFVFQKMPFLGG